VIKEPQRMKILIAEDDAISRRVLEATLINYGYKVVATCDGVEALAALEKEDAPTLAILDLKMPKMDGLEVCRKIRSIPKLRYTYIILLTNRNSVSDTVVGLQAGADDYIAKPYDRAELRARIQVGLRIIGMQKELLSRVCPKCQEQLLNDPVALDKIATL
jgi:DNA-binding response OmpR family regulator